MMTFLVVPALVVDGMGPLDAVSASTRLLRKTWGDQLVSNFGFGMVFFALGLPAWIAVIYVLVEGRPSLHVPILALAVGYLILLACVQSALHTIFQCSLYLYTRDGQAPLGFPKGLLDRAVVRA